MGGIPLNRPYTTGREFDYVRLPLWPGLPDGEVDRIAEATVRLAG